MAYFKVLQGLYYTLAGVHILESWLGDDYDWAQKESLPSRKDGDEGYGLLGFQTGLKYHQKISENTWETRVPFEFHLRRNIVEEWPLEFNPEIKKTYERLNQRDIIFYLEVEYVNTVTLYNIVDVFDRKTIELTGKPDFHEVKIQEMEVQNDPSPGTKFVKLGDTTDTPANSQDLDVADNHPKYFHLITPNSWVDTARNMNLTARVHLTPGSGMNRKELAIWFNPFNPNGVRNYIETSNFHLIDYDYFFF